MTSLQPRLAPRVTPFVREVPEAPPPVARRGRPLVVGQEPGQPERARLVGALTGDDVQVLLDAVDRGVSLLDVSQLDSVDEAAVDALAKLQPRRCSLLACPRWLELRLARVRWSSAERDRAA